MKVSCIFCGKEIIEVEDEVVDLSPGTLITDQDDDGTDLYVIDRVKSDFIVLCHNRCLPFDPVEMYKKRIATKVDLIASGYEWECPKCDQLNKEIEVTENVTCEECKSVFEVADYHHACE
jgi:DNA-directed RNA polymerase subunit RPC12/RpoP